MLVSVIESPIPTQFRRARWWAKGGNATAFLKWVRLSPTDTFRSLKDLIGWYGMASKQWQYQNIQSAAYRFSTFNTWRTRFLFTQAHAWMGYSRGELDEYYG